MAHSNTTDTNTLAETCDNKFEFDVASVSFAPDVSHLPLNQNIEFSKDTTDKEPVQLTIPRPGLLPERPLSLSEFIDIFYKSDKIGNCSQICYPLIDITSSTKKLLIPALCDKKSLESILKDQNGDVWCDITLKSFGRSPWWQSVELSTAMATAISELNCRHNVFCKKISNILRRGEKNGDMNENKFRTKLPDYNDLFRDGDDDTNRIPNLSDLVIYLDAWCGVLSVARQLGYLPKPPKNKVPLTSVCYDTNWETKCCDRTPLFKDEVWDLVPELCENIKNIKELEDSGIKCNKYTFLHWNDNAPNGGNCQGGFTTKINCNESDLKTMTTRKFKDEITNDDGEAVEENADMVDEPNEMEGGGENGEMGGGVEGGENVVIKNFKMVMEDVEDEGTQRLQNPTGHKHVSGLLKLIQMGLLDWNGCLAGRDDESGEDKDEDEIEEDLKNWKSWFIDLQGEETCNYDYDSSHIVPPDRSDDAKPNRLSTMSIAFLLKLATMKFASNDDFKNMLCINNFKNEDNSCYDYSQTLKEYFNPINEDNNKLINNCKYYNPCKRMNIKKNIIKSNSNLKHSLLRLCGGCALTKDELLTTISDYIVRDMNAPGGGVNSIVNAKFNINYCKQDNGIENVVMYDANILIDLGIYVALAAVCKDKNSVEKVIKYVFSNPSNDILGTIADTLLVELQTTYPSCYPAGFSRTQITEYGAKIYENVLAGYGNDPYDSRSIEDGGVRDRNAPDLTKRLLTSNKLLSCFKSSTNPRSVTLNKNINEDCVDCN